MTLSRSAASDTWYNVLLGIEKISSILIFVNKKHCTPPPQPQRLFGLFPVSDSKSNQSSPSPATPSPSPWTSSRSKTKNRSPSNSHNQTCHLLQPYSAATKPHPSSGSWERRRLWCSRAWGRRTGRRRAELGWRRWEWCVRSWWWSR